MTHKRNNPHKVLRTTPGYNKSFTNGRHYHYHYHYLIMQLLWSVSCSESYERSVHFHRFRLKNFKLSFPLCALIFSFVKLRCWDTWPSKSCLLWQTEILWHREQRCFLHPLGREVLYQKSVLNKHRSLNPTKQNWAWDKDLNTKFCLSSGGSDQICFCSASFFSPLSCFLSGVLSLWLSSGC